MARPRGSKKQREQAARLALGGGKLLGYVRVSTEGQAEKGWSLGGQRDRIRDACERAGYQLVAIIEDVASGAKTDRDGMLDAMRRVEAGEAEGIAFTKMDRTGRGLVGSSTFVAWAEQNGFTLFGADEGGPVVLRGEVVSEALPFNQAAAEWQRRYIIRRTREGLAAAKRRGVVLGSPLRRPCDDPAVQRAIALRRQGSTLTAIAQALDAEGVRGARGGALTAKAVWTWIERCAPAQGAQGGDAR